MNWKTWLPLVLAIVLGIFAAKIGKDLVSNGRSSGGPQAKTTKIVIAKGDIPPGQTLTEDDLKVGNYPADSVPRGSFTNPADVLLRVATSEIVSGQALTEGMLAPKGTAGGAQALIPDGMRAVTLQVNEYSGVAGLLLPGCRIDVIGSLRDDKSSQQIVMTLVENVKVIAVGQKFSSTKDPEGTQPAKSVTVLASPREAEAIELATNNGQTRLVLRGTFDNGSSRSTGLTIGELIGRPRFAESTGVPTTRPSNGGVAFAPTTRPSTDDDYIHKTIQIIRRGEPSFVELRIAKPNISDATTDPRPLVPNDPE